MDTHPAVNTGVQLWDPPSLVWPFFPLFFLFQKTRGGKGQENIFWIHFIKRMKETLLTKFKSNSGKLRAGAGGWGLPHPYPPGLAGSPGGW